MTRFENLKVSEKIQRLDEADFSCDDAVVILNLAQSDENENVRVSAVRAIGRSRFTNSTSTLSKILRNISEAKFIRKAALYSLSELNEPESIKEIVNFLNSGPEFELKHHALMMLSRTRTSEVASEIIPFLDEKNKLIKSWLAAELRNFSNTMDQGQKALVVKKLKKIALSDGESAVRRSTLLTIAHLTQDETQFYKEFIEKEPDEKNILRAIEALATQKSSAGIAYLLGIVVEERRARIADTAAQYTSRLASPEEKWGYFEEFISNHSMISYSIRYDILVKALAGDISANLIVISQYAFRLSQNASREVVSVCANIALDCFGGDRERVAHALEKYISAGKLDEFKFKNLRIELGGKTSLEPIFQELQRNLDENFSRPISDLNEKTIRAWVDSIEKASFGFSTRITMSIIVFAIGMTLVIGSTSIFFFDRNSGNELWGPGISLIGGLASMFAVVYAGPLKDIQSSVRDVARANIVFIGFIHSIMQLSHSFSSSYLKEDLSDEKIKKLNELILNTTVNSSAAITGDSHKNVQ